MKGIILAGGQGTRMYPVTTSTNKHLLPVYNKPLIFYSLSVLLLIGIRQICIITNSADIKSFKNLLGDGSSYGCDFIYREQAKPEGIPQAFLIAKDFIAGEKVALILGDNIFHGAELGQLIKNSAEQNGCSIICSRVSRPESYGVLELDEAGKPIRILEKPEEPPSNIAVTGLYLFDSTVVNRTQELKKSQRGEYEIADLINSYFIDKKVNCIILSRGFTWIDAGSFDTLLLASNLVQQVENRQGLKVGCLDEIARNSGLI